MASKCSTLTMLTPVVQYAPFGVMCELRDGYGSPGGAGMVGGKGENRHLSAARSMMFGRKTCTFSCRKLEAAYDVAIEELPGRPHARSRS